jgi:GrpB-like predicted nucleotidyltransferase (UPF0157 family)
MTSKPIIDLVLVIRSGDFDKIKSLLVERGYHHEGDKGIPGREAFKLKDEYDTRNLMKHHLYVCSDNNNAFRNHISFREFLKNNKEYAGKLSRLKWELAEKFDNDREAYIEGKAALCEEITRLALEQMVRNK